MYIIPTLCIYTYVFLAAKNISVSVPDDRWYGKHDDKMAKQITS